MEWGSWGKSHERFHILPTCCFFRVLYHFAVLSKEHSLAQTVHSPEKPIGNIKLDHECRRWQDRIVGNCEKTDTFFVSVSMNSDQVTSKPCGHFLNDQFWKSMTDFVLAKLHSWLALYFIVHLNQDHTLEMLATDPRSMIEFTWVHLWTEDRQIWMRFPVFFCFVCFCSAFFF